MGTLAIAGTGFDRLAATAADGPRDPACPPGLGSGRPLISNGLYLTAATGTALGVALVLYGLIGRPGTPEMGWLVKGGGAFIAGAAAAALTGYGIEHHARTAAPETGGRRI